MDLTNYCTHLSLCTGYGGIDRGLELAGFNIGATVYVEIEAFAVLNLAKKIESGAMGDGAIWPDLKSFPFRRFRGCFNILSGGFPCQPFSSAGKGLGDEDPRHLFPFIKEGIRQCRPSIVVLENVDGISSKKLKGDQWNDPAGTPVLLHVLRELERVGYTATAIPTSASEVGAPHKRNRWFIIGVANDSGDGCDRRPLQDRIREWLIPELPQSHEGGCAEVRSETSGRGECASVADSQCEGLEGLTRNGSGGGESRRIDSEEVRPVSSRGIWPARPLQEQFGWEPPRVVPHATTSNGRGGKCQEEAGIRPDGVGRVRPSVSGEGTVEPEVGGNADGSPHWNSYAELCTSCDNRIDELRLLGNGVVPQSCAAAVIEGLEELGYAPTTRR